MASKMGKFFYSLSNQANAKADSKYKTHPGHQGGIDIILEGTSVAECNSLLWADCLPS